MYVAAADVFAAIFRSVLRSGRIPSRSSRSFEVRRSRARSLGAEFCIYSLLLIYLLSSPRLSYAAALDECSDGHNERWTSLGAETATQG